MRFGTVPGSLDLVLRPSRRRRGALTRSALLIAAIAIALALAGTASANAPVPAAAPALANAPTLSNPQPLNSAPPQIKGSPQQGATLTGGPGVWTGSIDYAYQWLRCNSTGAECSAIPNATGTTYKLTNKDVGSTLVLRVTAGKTPATALASSRRTAVIQKGEGKSRGIFLACLALIAFLGFLLRKLLIGSDNRWSTSKVTAATWTYLLGAAVLGFIVSKFFGDPRALNKLMHSGLAGQYGLLIGGPLGAAIAAKGIVGSQTSKSATAKTAAPKAKASDVVMNDAEEADLGDVQYVLFNLIAMVYFVGSVIQSPAAGVPRIPDVLLGLTSVAAAGYVAKKALPSPTATAKVEPAKQRVGAPVTIKGTNLLTAEVPEQTVLIVMFGEVEQRQMQKKRDGVTEDTLTVTVPQMPAAAKVDVLIITAEPAIVRAGTIEVEA